MQFIFEESGVAIVTDEDSLNMGQLDSVVAKLKELKIYHINCRMESLRYPLRKLQSCTY